MERWTHVALNYLEFDKAMFAKTMGNGKMVGVERKVYSLHNQSLQSRYCYHGIPPPPLLVGATSCEISQWWS